MGMTEDKIDALFVAPEQHRKGVGRALVTYAGQMAPNLSVNVNEQNEAARSLYRRMGFLEIGRSGRDDRGRAFPIIRLIPERWAQALARAANVLRHSMAAACLRHLITGTKTVTSSIATADPIHGSSSGAVMRGCSFNRTLIAGWNISNRSIIVALVLPAFSGGFAPLFPEQLRR